MAKREELGLSGKAGRPSPASGEPTPPPQSHPAGLPGQGGALHEPERWARATLDGLSAHIAIVDAAGKIEAVNAAWREFALANGLAPQRCSEGANYLEVCDRVRGEGAEDAAHFAQGLREVLAGRRERFQMEYTCDAPNEARWFVARVTPFPQEPVRAIIAHENITERKRMEEALRESETRFREMAENIRDVLWLRTPDHARLLYVSPAYEAIWGRSCASLYAAPFSWLEAVVPEDRESARHVLSQKLLGEYDVEYRITRADGSVRWIHDRGFPIRDSSGKIVRVAGIAEDVTHRKQAEREIRQLTETLERRVAQRTAELNDTIRRLELEMTERKRAEKLSEKQRAELAEIARMAMAGELAATIAHELNQPLFAVINYAESGLYGLRSDPPRLEAVAEDLQNAIAQTERASGIIRRLRELARKRAPSRSTAELNTLVRDALVLIEPDLRLTEVRVDLQLHPDLPPLLVDRIQIQQVILNLVRNAIEAMVQTPAHKRRLTITTQPAGTDAVELTIADCGVGIPADALERIFDSFYTTKRDGVGMGLAISRSIVEAHGGRLWAAQRRDGGSVFHCRLPIRSEGARNAAVC